jgi:hypothetical protein
MDFHLPPELTRYLTELDDFIEKEIRPLEEQDDNIRFFDHRREWARTDFEGGGLPRKEWEDLLKVARRKADEAGHLRFPLPKQFGGKDGSNLAMTVIREHLAAKGLGLHNDLQNEHSIVANNPFVLLFRDAAGSLVSSGVPLIVLASTYLRVRLAGTPERIPCHRRREHRRSDGDSIDHGRETRGRTLRDLA